MARGMGNHHFLRWHEKIDEGNLITNIHNISLIFPVVFFNQARKHSYQFPYYTRSWTRMEIKRITWIAGTERCAFFLTKRLMIDQVIWERDDIMYFQRQQLLVFFLSYACILLQRTDLARVLMCRRAGLSMCWCRWPVCQYHGRFHSHGRWFMVDLFLMHMYSTYDTYFTRKYPRTHGTIESVRAIPGVVS